MDDYISRADALDALKQCKMHCIDPFDSYHIDAEEADFAISRIPAADVVPVVRCKDCKNRESDDFCVGRGFPYQLVPDDGFCNKGKSKEKAL